MYLKIDRLKRFLTKTIFTKKEKTFLEDIKPLIFLGKIYGTVLFASDDESIFGTGMKILPLLILYIICCYFSLITLDTHKNISVLQHKFSMILLFLTIGGTIMKFIYFFLRRQEHKNLILKIHQLNRLLGYEKRPSPSLKWPVFKIISHILSRDITFYITFKKVQVNFMNIPNMLVLGWSFNACILNEFITRFIGQELLNQFRILNQKILIISETVGTICGDVESILELIRFRKILSKLSLKFNEFCILPLLVTLALQGCLSVWMLYNCFLHVVLQTPGYVFVILMMVMRTALTTMYTLAIIGGWTAIQKEVSAICRWFWNT